MGYKLLPLLVMGFFLSLLSIEKNTQEGQFSSINEIKTESGVSNFISYRNSVLLYHQLNPDFVGVVPQAFIQEKTNIISNEFFARTGNTIVRMNSGNNTWIISYISMSQEERGIATRIGYEDESLGSSYENIWKSYLNPGSPITLPVFLPNGATVSISQTGT